MKIALDFDGVLANTMSVWIKHFNKDYNRNVTLADVKQFNFWNDFGITRDEMYNLFHKSWADIDEIPAYEPNVSEPLKELNEIAEVDVVTACMVDVKGWLDRYKIPFRALYCVAPTDKSTMNYDVYIDDNPLLVEKLSPNKLCLLYNQPWNQNIKSNAYYRIHKMQNAVDFIRSLILKKEKIGV